MTPAAKLSSIRQISITVSDVDTALVFYRDVLGLDFLFRAGPQLAFLNCGGVRLMLTTPQGSGKVGANSILYFSVTDIETVHKSLVANSAQSEREPAFVAPMPDHDLWSSFLRDPDGNLLALMEEKPRA